MKKLNFALMAIMAIFAVSCGEKQPIDDGKKYGDLGIFFDTDNPVVDAGKTIGIPFTVTGSEGVTLTIEASCADTECKIDCKYGASYTGTISFTAPVITKEKKVEVKLKAYDTHNRNVEKSIVVKVNASPDLEVVPVADIKSIAIKPEGKYSLSFKVNNLDPGTISKAEVSADGNWASTCKVDGDKIDVDLTAPAALGNSLTIKVSVTDSFGRKAEGGCTITIVPITTTENAANCFIVKPGSTLTIKGVKGNSAEELTFDNAVLLWQDAKSLVKSVAGNGTEKVVVVETSDGVGNAVVAATLEGKVVWSWHLWVADYDPDDDPMVWTSKETGITYTYMDRNLGALGNAKNSDAAASCLFYQWGRKDPIVGSNKADASVIRPLYDLNNNQVYFGSEKRPVYDDHTTDNLQLSIENPMKIYWAPSTDWPYVDWLTDEAALQNDDLWGGVSKVKSIYDPCPEGWEIPETGDAWGFRNEYKSTGSVSNWDIVYDPDYPWYIDNDLILGFRYKQENGNEYWFPLAGEITGVDQAALVYVGEATKYCTKSVNSTYGTFQAMAWGNPTGDMGLNRVYGGAVRCVKEKK